jgi:Spy/CpxP family protein refolding chaperone
MKTTKWLFLTVAAAILAGGWLFTLHAAPLKQRQAADGPTRGHLLQRAKEKLNLTDDQISQIKEVLKAEKEDITGLLTRLHDARSDMRQAIHASDANESSVRAASAKVAAVEADLAVERFQLYGKIAPILTTEQRDKLQQMAAQVDDFVDGAINRLGQKLSE